MTEKRVLPPQMRKHAAGRTDAAIGALFNHLDQLENEIRKGLVPEYQLDLKTISEKAGLNPKFLYGRIHNQSSAGTDSTKTVVQNRLRKLNNIVTELKKASFKATQPNDVERFKSEAAYWKERYEKLARHTNMWFARMREQQKAIRNLKNMN